MKNLKILFLTFALLLPVFSSYATGNPQKQCVVKIIVSEKEKIIKTVSIGTVCEDLLRELKQPTVEGKVFVGWDIDGVNSDHVIFNTQDTTVIEAMWISQEEAILKQDTMMWNRSFKSFVTDLMSDSNSTELTKQDQKGDFWLYVMFGLSLLLSIISIVLSLLLPKKYQKHFQDNEDFAEAVVNIVKEHEKSEKWRNPGNVAAKSTESPSTSYDSDIRDLRGRVNVLEDKLRNSTKENTTTVTTSSSQGKSNVPTSSEQYLYADSIVNDKFHKVTESPSEDSVFELKLKGGSKASVTIYKPAYGKVLANASFLEGCDKQIMGYTSVHIDREGTAEKDDNGKWKVVNPLKVILK